MLLKDFLKDWTQEKQLVQIVFVENFWLCSSQLSCVFTMLFSWSLRDCTVPSIWKTSTICPVPKSRSPSELNDYRPAALTSVVMKCFERIVLQRLLTQTQHLLDPHQFAYKQNRSIDDARCTTQQCLPSSGGQIPLFVSVLFVDLSSAFNTIQPHKMALKFKGARSPPQSHPLDHWLPP